MYGGSSRGNPKRVTSADCFPCLCSGWLYLGVAGNSAQLSRDLKWAAQPAGQR